MIFIIGGAYQGKLEYAKNKFGLNETDIFECSSEGQIDFSRKCIYASEEFAMSCVKSGKDAVKVFCDNRAKWKDSIIIMRDIFCGVVPMGAENRAWREMAGRLAGYLSNEAEKVIRIFCGLEQILK